MNSGAGEGGGEKGREGDSHGDGGDGVGDADISGEVQELEMRAGDSQTFGEAVCGLQDTGECLIFGE